MMIEGADYFVRLIPFANTKNPAIVSPNDDGTYDIYINSLCGDDKRKEALQHELDHLYNDDLYSDEDIRVIEGAEPLKTPNLLCINDNCNIVHFESLESLKKFVLAYAEQQGVKIPLRKDEE